MFSLRVRIAQDTIYNVQFSPPPIPIPILFTYEYPSCIRPDFQKQNHVLKQPFEKSPTD